MKSNYENEAHNKEEEWNERSEMSSGNRQHDTAAADDCVSSLIVHADGDCTKNIQTAK